MTKETKTRLFVTAITVGIMTALYMKESDLAYNVAQQRDILLGRYTLESTITLLILTIIAICVIAGTWKNKPEKTPEQKRQDAFKTIALTISILLAVAFFDIGLRIVQSGHYVKQGASYHRKPNKVFEGVFEDTPETHFTYPKRATGCPATSYTLTVDGNGFRNVNPPETADWLILGDSFAEGSNVTDADVWWSQLAAGKSVTVYNLGMSGGNPLTYLDTLNKFGLAKQPKTVVYMLYEGNDFRDGNFPRHTSNERPKESLGDIVFKKSPLRWLIKDSIRRTLSPIGAKRFLGDERVDDPSHPMWPVAWLPLETPAGSDNFYTFDLKRLLQHMVTAEEFENSRGGKESKRLLLEAKAICDQNNIRLIVVYAPDKPHVLIDAIIDQVPTGQLKAFLDMKARNLPDPLTAEVLRSRVAVQENAFERVCRENNIEFISLTKTLKQATAAGTQTYFTYDQHWTPQAHKSVADHLTQTIQ